MSKTPQPIKVTYHETKFTGIPVTITSGVQTFKFFFVALWNPIPDLLQWLEQIAAGAFKCTLSFDEEGPQTELNFYQTDGMARLVIERCDSYGSACLESWVDPLQLVDAFYNGLIAYMHSPLYVHDEWVVEYINDKPLTDNKSFMLERWLIKHGKKISATSGSYKLAEDHQKKIFKNEYSLRAHEAISSQPPMSPEEFAKQTAAALSPVRLVKSDKNEKNSANQENIIDEFEIGENDEIF